MAWAQKAISLEVSCSSTFTRDLNHCLSESISETVANSQEKSCDAIRVILSKRSSGDVSNISKLRNVSIRFSSFGGNTGIVKVSPKIAYVYFCV